MEKRKTDMQEAGIEESFERLEEILAGMEKEETGLEESFRLYEEGIRILQNTEKNIERVEQKIRVLSGQEKPEDL